MSNNCQRASSTWRLYTWDTLIGVASGNVSATKYQSTCIIDPYAMPESEKSRDRTESLSLSRQIGSAEDASNTANQYQSTFFVMKFTGSVISALFLWS